MTTPTRPTTPPAAPTVREQLILGATELLDTEGLGDLSVRRLATAAGRTTMCVYSKYGSRGALLQAVYDQLGAELLDRLQRLADPEEELSTVARETPHRYAFLIGTDPALLGLDPGPRGTFLEQLVQVLGRGDADAGRAAFSRVHGAVVLGGDPRV